MVWQNVLSCFLLFCFIAFYTFSAPMPAFYIICITTSFTHNAGVYALPHCPHHPIYGTSFVSRSGNAKWSNELKNSCKVPKPVVTHKVQIRAAKEECWNVWTMFYILVLAFFNRFDLSLGGHWRVASLSLIVGFGGCLGRLDAWEWTRYQTLQKVVTF